MSQAGFQQLFASNVSPDIDTALEARIKDALWFLARQWQLGEFEAETGGLPVRVHVVARNYPLQTCARGGQTVTVRPDAPLEHLIEAEIDPAGEDARVQPPGWNSAALEYEFSLSTGPHALSALGYDGRALDWHDFTLSRDAGIGAHGVAARPGAPRMDESEEADKAGDGIAVSLSMIPGQLQIKGVPEPRFWEIEDRDAYFDSGESAEPNILSVLLPEFFYADMKNWYMIPAPMPSGAVREVEEVVVVDSFGVVTSLGPVGGKAQDDPWAVFALDLDDGTRTDSSTLLCLNTAARVGENDLVEEVRFLRDESANLVWGWERQLSDPDRGLFSTVFEPQPTRLDPGLAVPDADLRFRLKSETARSFVPYVPRHTGKAPAVKGDIALRRARSGEQWSTRNPQYRGEIIRESAYLNEEDIPRSGIRIRRQHRFARGSDDEVYFWVGRDKDVAGPTRKPKLTFDDLLKLDPKA